MGRFSVQSTEEQEQALLPDGIHIMRVSEVDDHKPTKNGDWMAKVTFEAVKGEYAGKTAVDYIVVPKASSASLNMMWKARVFLKAIGEPHKGPITVDTDNWFRKVVKVEVKGDEFNGKTTAKIAKYLSMEGAEAVAAKSDAPDNEVPF